MISTKKKEYMFLHLCMNLYDGIKLIFKQKKKKKMYM